MKRVIVICLLLAITSLTYEQTTPEPACPNTLEYESTVMEPGRWYGVTHLTTDITLHSLWLNIVLDRKADLLGNWVGEVTTRDNIDYKIENTNIKIHPGSPFDIRFYINYKDKSPPPKIMEIWLNGRLICNITAHEVITEKPMTKKQELISEQSSPNRIPLKIDPISSTTMKTIGLTLPTRTVITSTTEAVGNENFSDDDYIIGPYNIVWRPEPEQCGQVLVNNAIPLISNGTPTLEGQWPWQIALYQSRLRTVDNKYICSGTLISKQHVITAAHCVTRKNSKRIVNKSTLTVYLGRHNLRTSIDGVQIELVNDIIVHPDYDPFTFARDLSILKLRKAISYTNWVQPACLWPDDAVGESNIIGKSGSVVGWGFDGTGIASEELTLVEMPVVDTTTCIKSYSSFFKRFTSDTTYCAGYRQGNKVCNGDSGTGMVFKRSSSWYLRGLVALSVATSSDVFSCDANHYVIFTDLAKFLPWIKDNINT